MRAIRAFQQTAEAAERDAAEQARAFEALQPDPLDLAIEAHEAYEEAERARLSLVEARGARARANRDRSEREDEAVLPRFVALICAGEVTKTAAAALKIGYERGKRLRHLAVERGMLAGRRSR